MPHRKHVPLRSCIACRRKASKRDLIRVVRTPEGTLEIDSKGKRQGRGAYLCRTRQCCETALQPGRLSQALKHTVNATELEALRTSILLLIEESPVESETTLLSGPSAQG